MIGVKGLICRRGDSNPHELPHTPLKRARLPVPPLRHKCGQEGPVIIAGIVSKESDEDLRFIRTEKLSKAANQIVNKQQSVQTLICFFDSHSSSPLVNCSLLANCLSPEMMSLPAPCLTAALERASE